MNYKQAVEAALQGNTDAFSALYESTQNNMYYLALKYMKNPDDAKDVLQDAYIKAWQSLPTLKDPEHFPAWLGRIVANTAKNMLVKKKPDLFSELEKENEDGDEFVFQIEDENTSYQPELNYTQKETQILVRELIDSLSDEQRFCILMYHLEGQSIKEIAETLDVSENTVKSRLNYGRKALKNKAEELKKKGYQLYSIAPLPLLLYLLRSESKSPAFTHAAKTVMLSRKETIMQHAGQSVQLYKNNNGNGSDNAGNGNNNRNDNGKNGNNSNRTNDSSTGSNSTVSNSTESNSTGTNSTGNNNAESNSTGTDNTEGKTNTTKNRNSSVNGKNVSRTAAKSAGTAAKHSFFASTAGKVVLGIAAGLIIGGGGAAGVMYLHDTLTAVPVTQYEPEENETEQTTEEEASRNTADITEIPQSETQQEEETQAEATPTSEPSPTPEPSPTSELSPTPEPSPTPELSPTQEPSPTPEPTEGASDSVTAAYQAVLEQIAAAQPETEFSEELGEAQYSLEGTPVYTLYDMNQGGTDELIVGQGFYESSPIGEMVYRVYTCENDGSGYQAKKVSGTWGDNCSIFRAPDGNGLYSYYFSRGTGKESYTRITIQDGTIVTELTDYETLMGSEESNSFYEQYHLNMTDVSDLSALEK